MFSIRHVHICYGTDVMYYGYCVSEYYVQLTHFGVRTQTDLLRSRASRPGWANHNISALCCQMVNNTKKERMEQLNKLLYTYSK